MRMIATLFTKLSLALALTLCLTETKPAEAAFTLSAGSMKLSFLSFSECLQNAHNFGKKTGQKKVKEEVDPTAQTYFAEFERKEGSHEKPSSIECKGGNLIMRNVKFQL